MSDKSRMTIEEGKSAIIDQMQKGKDMHEFVVACKFALEILDRIDVPESPRAAFLEKRNNQLEDVLNDITARVRNVHIGGTELTITGIKKSLERYTQREVTHIPPGVPPIPACAEGYLHAWRAVDYGCFPMWCWLDIHGSVYTQHDQGGNPKPHFRYYGSFVTHELLRLVRKVGESEEKDE